MWSKSKFRIQSTRLFFAIFCLLLSSQGFAKVLRVEVKLRQPVLDGKVYGQFGDYELVNGTIYFGFDPASPMNAEVRLVAADTDLKFSIKDIPVISCAGSHNIPDGECFTAPLRDSVNGTIHYNTATIYQGTTFSDVRLTFEKGCSLVEAGAF